MNYNNYLFTDIYNVNHIIVTTYILLVIYIIFIIPNLNKETMELFDNKMMKLLTLLMIVYISLTNPKLATLLTIAFTLTIMEINKHNASVVKDNNSNTQNNNNNNKNNINQGNEDNNVLNDTIVHNYSLDTSSDQQQLLKYSLDKDKKSIEKLFKRTETKEQPTKNVIEGKYHIVNDIQPKNTTNTDIEGYVGHFSVLDNAALY